MARNMIYTEGDEVRYALTGQFGTIEDVDEINQEYTVNINGVEYIVTEDELD